MSKLIEALQIFLKYGDPTWPTHCEHDTLWICGYGLDDIKDPADVQKLDDLGFFWSDDRGAFISYKYGSA